MTKMSDIRLRNLRRLLDQAGGAIHLAPTLGYSNPSYLSQLAGPNPTRTISERTARTIEQKLGLPEGCMDGELPAGWRLVTDVYSDPPRVLAAQKGLIEPEAPRALILDEEDKERFARAEIPKPAPPRREFSYAGPIEPGISKDLPVYGAFKGSFDGAEINYQDPVERIERPVDLIGVIDAFAAYIVNDSMYPRYAQGEKVLVHPGKPVKKGDYVVVILRNDHGLVKQFLRSNNDFVELAQLNPPETKKFPKDEIAGVYKITGTQTD